MARNPSIEERPGVTTVLALSSENAGAGNCSNFPSGASFRESRYSESSGPKAASEILSESRVTWLQRPDGPRT